MESWAPIIFIVLAIAMAVGPVLMLKPSKRQQGVAKLRARALDMNLQVHMLPLSKGRSSVSAYCRPWREKGVDKAPWVLERKAYEHDLHYYKEWAWQADLVAGEHWRARLKPLLTNIPQQLLAIGSGPQGLCCYWDERGGEPILEEIAVILEKLSR